jgi:O-glycosyl hydrolase
MNLLKKCLKKLILFILICSTNLFNGQNTTTVSPEIEHQTIEGWGVSLAWWANLAGNWSQATIDELAGYAVNDLNLNVFRFNIGAGENPNCTSGDHIRKDGGNMPGYRSPKQNDQGWGVNNLSNDYRQINVMNKIAELRVSKDDIITEMISYSPPWWMTYGECTAGNINETSENLKTEFIDDFADYLASVTAELNTAYPNWNIRYIEPFNEPTSGYWKKGVQQDGSAIYPDTQAQILLQLQERKNFYGIEKMGLAASDNTSITKALSNMTTLKNDNPEAYKSLSKINTHSYGGSRQEKVQLANFALANDNKPIWQTESGPLNWNPPTDYSGQHWIRHYDMAYRIVEDLRNLKSTVWCDWQLLSIDDGWGMLHQTNWNENNPTLEPTLKKTRSFYTRKNFTNFIKVGYKIIDTDTENTIAALSPDGSELVIVLVNASGNSSTTNFDLSRFSLLHDFKTYRTSGENEGFGEDTTEKTRSSLNEKGVLSDKTLSYTAPIFSVTTFVIQLTKK